MKKITPPLPVKYGVSPNALWLPDGNWSTVYDFFLEKFSHLAPEECAKRFDNNQVVTAKGEILSLTSRYQSKQHIYFYRELVDETKIPFKEKIIYQDDLIVIADKPHFLAVAPTGQYLQETLLVRLRNQLNLDSLELCHRLDRETAGLVLLSKQPLTRSHYHALFAEKKIAKTYHALIIKNSQLLPQERKSRLMKGEPFFRMKEVAGSHNSETRIKKIEDRRDCTLCELKPITGKKHQLRVHLAALGRGIINDSFYPKLIKKESDDFTNPLQLLAKSIEFIDPINGKKHYFESSFCL